MELWDLYDLERVPTGETMRRGTEIPAGKRHIVVNIWLFDSEGRLLIQRRQPFKEGWSGMWDGTTGGSAVAGENDRQAAHRELLEEMGIDYDFTGEAPRLEINLQKVISEYFIIRGDVPLSSLRLQPEEVAEAKYATREEVLAMIDEGTFIPYNKGFVELMFHLRTSIHHRTRPDTTVPAKAKILSR